MKDTMADVLRKVGGGVIAATFDRMLIAEQEIIRGKLRGEKFRLSFGMMCTPPILQDLSPEVYRAHARELVERMLKTRDAKSKAFAECTKEATDAECLALLMRQATAHPLASGPAKLAEYLFRKVLGKDADRALGSGEVGLGDGSYPDELPEILRDLRRQATRLRACT